VDPRASVEEEENFFPFQESNSGHPVHNLITLITEIPHNLLLLLLLLLFWWVKLFIRKFYIGFSICLTLLKTVGVKVSVRNAIGFNIRVSLLMLRFRATNVLYAAP
jgi:hypothetical protein